MKVYTQLRRTQEMREELLRNGYSELIYQTGQTGIRNMLSTLMTCQAYIHDDDEEASDTAVLLYNVAKMCGLDIIERSSLDVAKNMMLRVSIFYGITIDDLRSSSRKGVMVRARIMLAYEMDRIGISYHRINTLLCRNRVSPYYYIRKANELMQYDRAFRNEYAKIFHKK